jgi:hypothetical protein
MQAAAKSIHAIGPIGGIPFSSAESSAAGIPSISQSQTPMHTMERRCTPGADRRGTAMVCRVFESLGCRREASPESTNRTKRSQDHASMQLLPIGFGNAMIRNPSTLNNQNEANAARMTDGQHDGWFKIEQTNPTPPKWLSSRRANPLKFDERTHGPAKRPTGWMQTRPKDTSPLLPDYQHLHSGDDARSMDRCLLFL